MHQTLNTQECRTNSFSKFILAEVISVYNFRSQMTLCGFQGRRESCSLAFLSRFLFSIPTAQESACPRSLVLAFSVLHTSAQCAHTTTAVGLQKVPCWLVWLDSWSLASGLALAGCGPHRSVSLIRGSASLWGAGFGALELYLLFFLLLLLLYKTL